MIEVEKHRAQKTELEAILSGQEPITTLEPEEAEVENRGPDRNMKVCEICGALQIATDTESRLQMHLEGKLHQGYQKIRD
jgi:RNA-binding protein Luc7-like 2